MTDQREQQPTCQFVHYIDGQVERCINFDGHHDDHCDRFGSYFVGVSHMPDPNGWQDGSRPQADLQTTHWEGCENAHPACATLAERARAAAVVRRFGDGDYRLGWDAEDVARAIERGEHENV